MREIWERPAHAFTYIERERGLHMIRGDIQLQAETPEGLRIALELIARSVVGSCRLDEPDGEQRYGPDLDESIIIATFKVLPEYREGDVDKFVGCAPDFTGGLTTEEYIDKIRGER